ncbi:aspartyl protease family protein [Roseivirga sp.]|uniref:aspartyl protease family protein n=1 Tax=Roseivirga sp. TaxID=1964215 RepID=UPI003B8D3FF8
MRNSLLIVLLFCGSIAFGNEPIASFPFKIHLGHIYIKAKINDGRIINVVFDTGAGANLASKEVAEELNLKISGSQLISGASGPVSIDSSQGNELVLGGDLEMENQTFLVMNLDHLGDSDYPLDALIGANVLRQYVVELNFDDGIMNLYNSSGFKEPETYTKQKISLVPYGIPIITADFNYAESKTLNGSYLVDTGAALALRMNTPLVKRNKLIESITPNYVYTSQALKNSADDYIGRLNAYSVLGERFTDIPIRMATVTSGVSSWDTVDGILGLEILKRFNMIFDYSRQVMYVKKNSLSNLPFRNNTTGLKLKKKGDYLEVESIITGSAAAKVDIQEGDKIVSIDGKKQMTFDEFKAYTNERKSSISLVLERGGNTKTVSINPFSMID